MIHQPPAFCDHFLCGLWWIWLPAPGTQSGEMISVARLLDVILRIYKIYAYIHLHTYTTLFEELESTRINMYIYIYMYVLII